MLKDWGIEVGVNGVGTWYDNAPMESFFATLKSAWVHHSTCRTRQQAMTDLFYYIEAFYNRRQIHWSLGCLSPITYEQLYHESIDLA